MTLEEKMEVLNTYQRYVLVFSPSYNVSKPHSVRHSHGDYPIREGKSVEEVVDGMYETIKSLMYLAVTNFEEQL